MYERKLPESQEITEFGVSGLLYNANLLMYDRETETLWDQIGGNAVRGELVGQQLDRYPFQILTWGQWKELYPDSEVLSRFTGHQREYDFWPYELYDTSDSQDREVTAENAQFPPKTRVIGVTVEESFVAYLEEDLLNEQVFNDAIGSQSVLLLANQANGNTVAAFSREVDGTDLTFVLDGDGRLKDQETWSTWSVQGVATDGELEGHRLEQIDATRLFWFAWIAFHPETEVRRPV